jgi:hypothetical protein
MSPKASLPDGRIGNQDKWKAAKAIADKNNIGFRILTEEGLRKLGYTG